MANPSATVLTSAMTRVWIIEGGARIDHAPVYESCLRMQGVSQGFGDIEAIECPDPQNYGKFIEKGQIKGATERPSTTVEGRYLMDALSTLLALAKKGCNFDVQLHMGQCTDPSIFNTYKKSIVFSTAAFTTYDTDELGALGSEDNAAVNETGDLSAKDLYEVVPLNMASVAASQLTNEVVDVAQCDSQSCGECENESDGCKKFLSLTKAAGGSPSTPADLGYTLDGGAVWYFHDVDTLGAAEEPSALDCVGLYVVVVANATDSLHIALKSELDGVTDPAFTEVTTGIVAAGSPNNLWSFGNGAFVVGDAGYVYRITDPADGVTVLDAGNATVEKLLAVHGLSESFAVAVGQNGAVIYTEDGSTWSAVAVKPVAAGVHLNSVAVKGEFEWIVVTSNGRMYYTLNKGATWTEKAFPGSGSGVAYSIAFASQSVGYLSHSTTVPRARILRSIDGGYSWQVLPEETGTMPLADRVNALAACSWNPNLVIGGGLADDAADGYLVIGSA